MIPLGNGSDDERRLVRRFRGLGSGDRQTLLAFAEFLTAGRREAGAESHPAEPLPLSRPGQETVIAAIKRLSQSYPMLDRAPLLSETASLMSTHLMQGQAADAVIDKLEALFARHYAAYREPFDKG